MLTVLRIATLQLLFFSALLGILYPGVVTTLAQLIFPFQANGSLVSSTEGRPTHSALIGQPFDAPEYFWGRPSATAPFPYNAAASSGSNLGPTNPALADAVKTRMARLQAADPGNSSPIPIDLVTASASGLDPHISPASAAYQIGRVAKTRQLDPQRLQDLVRDHSESRLFGILGEPRVNVVALNRALDALH